MPRKTPMRPSPRRLAATRLTPLEFSWLRIIAQEYNTNYSGALLLALYALKGESVSADRIRGPYSHAKPF